MARDAAQPVASTMMSCANSILQARLQPYVLSAHPRLLQT
jgi:hypothetical protein